MIRIAAIVAAVAVLGCGSGPEAGAARLTVAYFTCDATPPVGHPLIGKKALEVVEEPLLLKGVILDDGRTRAVLAALDWCTLGTEVYHRFRRALGEGAGTPNVALQCTHTHSAPFRGGQDTAFMETLEARLEGAAREAKPRRVTHVGWGMAKVERFASNRRVPGPDGKILVRWSATKDAALREMPEGRIDPWLRTVTFFDGARPIARLHYYASHPQSFYGDGRAHPDVPGWARSRLEAEEGVPHVYFTGCAGNVTAGKYNDGTPEARARLVERLADGMRRSIRETRREPASALAWKTTSVTLARRKKEAGEDWPPIELSLLETGAVGVLHLPGEPFVEFQLYAQSLRSDRFLAVAGYGDGGPGYICTDDATGGYEPTASNVGPPTERVLKAGIRELLR